MWLARFAGIENVRATRHWTSTVHNTPTTKRAPITMKRAGIPAILTSNRANAVLILLFYHRSVPRGGEQLRYHFILRAWFFVCSADISPSSLPALGHCVQVWGVVLDGSACGLRVFFSRLFAQLCSVRTMDRSYIAQRNGTRRCVLVRRLYVV